MGKCASCKKEAKTIIVGPTSNALQTELCDQCMYMWNSLNKAIPPKELRSDEEVSNKVVSSSTENLVDTRTLTPQEKARLWLEKNSKG